MVDKLAFEGELKSDASHCYQASLHSSIKPNSPEVVDIYGELKNLRLGFDDLDAYLSRSGYGNFNKRLNNRIKYMVQLNRLGKLLSSNANLAQNIQEALAEEEVAKHNSSDKALASYLAEIYSDNFSTLSRNFRIVVLGKKEHLRRDENVERIRAMLFAGVRASLLWRVHGSGMLTMMLRRGKMLRQVQDIIAQISTEPHS